MVGLTSVVQSALSSTLSKALPNEPLRAARMSLAWNRLLMIQLELFLAVMVRGWDSE